ncbi:30S ribosomal protein S4e [Halodesulfurarchaeum sp.]|uniref:30S ribosomal protein S4e n=1 Tax=Halodesulfurarchaeum sp. TaxID=1980530 RepID=UPI001BC824FC|nr:30S ribosomal protein S4e [Halodesulfurarchaeum sp.]
MSNHQKRLSVPKSWPVERKTATFTAKANAGPHGESGVPLVIVLRDVLGYVDTATEATYAVNSGGVLVNGDTVEDRNRPIGMFDILAFPERDEYYRVFPDEGGRLGLTPLDEADAGSKLGKIIDKTTVSGGRTQLNLHDGANLVVEDDTFSGKDSIVLDNEENEIVAHFEYGEGALVTAVAGQHAGEIGEVADISVTPGSASNTVIVDRSEDTFETVEEYVVVIDENFVGDDASLPGAEETTEDESTEEEDESDETDDTTEGED